VNAVTRAAAAVAAAVTSVLLQATLIGPLTFPVSVSLPALVVAVLAVYAGPGVGMGFGFGVGLLADLGSDHPAGVQALCWLGAGLAAGIVGGLAVERGYSTRGVAALTAALATVSGWVVAVLLVLLGSHGATIGSACRDLVPVVLTDALLGLAVVPLVRAGLRAQGVQVPRARADVLRRSYVAN
jgi:rod shape-determining protein MreD